MSKPTTAKERQWLRNNWDIGDPTFVSWLAGSKKAHELVPRLLNDIDRLEAEVTLLTVAINDAGCCCEDTDV